MYSSAASDLGSPCLQRPVCLNTEDKCSKVNILNQTEKLPVSHPGRRFILFIYLFIYFFFFADSRRTVVSFWQKNVHKYWLMT